MTVYVFCRKFSLDSHHWFLLWRPKYCLNLFSYFFTGRRLLLYCHVSGSRQTLLLGSTYILWQTMANEEVMRREESHQKVSEMRFFFLLSIECSLLLFHNKATHWKHTEKQTSCKYDGLTNQLHSHTSE